MFCLIRRVIGVVYEICHRFVFVIVHKSVMV